MFKRIFFLMFLFCFSTNFAQQKKALTHDDYDLWKNITGVETSKDGQTVTTTISTTTGRGDGYLKIYNTRTGRSSDFHNGYKANISADGNYVFFLRKPDYEVIRQEKKKEVKKDDQSKDAFFIYDVKNNRIYDSIPRVKSYEVPKEESGWLVIEKFKELKPEKDTSAAEIKPVDTTMVKKKKNPAYEEDYALVYNLQNKKRDTIFKLKTYRLPEKGEIFYFSTTKGEKKGDIGIYEYNIRNNERKAIDTGRFAYEKLAVDNQGKQLAYLSAKDSTENDSLKYELFYFKAEKLSKITDTLGKNLNQDWELSNAQAPYFSKNGKRLYFYSRPERSFNIDTTLLKEEVPEVDVWNYQDKLIQPEQKARLKELSDMAFLSFYNTENNNVISLHDETLEFVILDEDAEQRYVLGYTSSPYDISRSWEYPWSRDYYIIDTRTGNKTLALEEASGTPYLAPNQTHALHYDIKTQDWWSLNLTTNEKKNLTKELGVAFFDEENDLPADPGAYGFGGFTKNMEALFFDQFDIWKVDLSKNAAPVKLTKKGREKKTQFRTLRLDRENWNNASYLDGRLLVSAFDKTAKTESLYSINPRNGKMEPLLETKKDLILNGFYKPENADIILYRKQNFRTYPDLFLYRSKKEPSIRITNVNPQQDDFKWGTAELFTWTSYDSIPLEGIVYKPDNFDPNKKYPLITYFYEKRSDNLHSYSSPQPSASIVNMPYLVSNDYIVFVPDIVYKEGKPGESAYNSIVAGVEALEKEGYIDSENMGIQGQSWGGYQVAHLITVTNKFKAAMAGAPVANMTSAYGGIRWQTGISRAFQYEKTQSRIGKNLWEGLDLYLENSPLFGIPNIETPLLMMHNDADGAVPYYQGIEMFMGMRRLNKPVWLLVYNDEAHNLTKVKNKQDLSIRMMQFFDHYLKGAPAPVWMTEGVPAVMKGKDLQYELERK